MLISKLPMFPVAPISMVIRTGGYERCSCSDTDAPERAKHPMEWLDLLDQWFEVDLLDHSLKR